MDRERDLKYLGCCGVIGESFRIIFASPKIFRKIVLAFILPLALINLAYLQSSDVLVSKINSPKNSEENLKFSRFTSSHSPVFWIFTVFYFIFTFIFSLSSTSVVVYTIACIYTKKEITFKQVIKIVPKVWRRLLVTVILGSIIFMFGFILIFVFLVVVALLLILFVWILGLGQSILSLGHTVIEIVAMLLFIPPTFILFIYWHIVCQLANVVTVMEDVYGIKAMVKSKNLIKGKIIVSSAIFFVLCVLSSGIEMAFGNVSRNSISLGVRIPIGILRCLLLAIVLLLGSVSQTIIYFVCKSHHGETILIPSLSAHLEEDHVRSESDEVVQLIDLESCKLLS